MTEQRPPACDEGALPAIDAEGREDARGDPARDTRAMRAEKIYAAIRESRMSDWVGGGDPAAIAAENFISIVENLALRRDASVLDFGCGIGRTSVKLAEFLSEGGRLVGSDMVPGQIAFCRKEFAEAFPNATFHCVRASNPAYDALAALTADASTPIDEERFFLGYREAFDLVVAFSVFTHFDPAMAARYLKFLGEATKPGGHLLLTWFLDHPGNPAESRLDPGQGFRDRDGNLQFAIYSLASVLALCTGAGLVIERISYGAWRGPPSALKGLHGHDIVILRRPLEPLRERDIKVYQDPAKTDPFAARTWNRVESLGETDNRIHDGTGGEEALRARATWYVESLLFGRFPQAVPPAAAEVLEIGSGVGWIMQAMNEYLSSLGVSPGRIVGLDVAPNMLAKARQRLGDSAPYDFRLYDGTAIPCADRSFDLIYSVACLQHVPRPYVFNLFFEIRRILKKKGFGLLHFLSTEALPEQEALVPWRVEIERQVKAQEGHWHHFYTRQELADVLAITGFPYVVVYDNERGGLVACVSNSSLGLPEDFDPEAYLAIHSDVRDAHEDPVRHYLMHGHGEGRKWFRERRPVSHEIAHYHFRERCVALLAERDELRAELQRLHARDGGEGTPPIDPLIFYKEISSLRAELESMRDSVSWRLTAPLRRLRRAVLRGK